MPGPYDIYGDYQSERTVSSKLPFGLGGDGVMGWAPELALWGIGSLTYRYGIKTGLSATADAAERGFKYSAHQKRVAGKVAKTAASGGHYGAVRNRMAVEMFQSQVGATKTRTTVGFRERRVGHGRNAPQRKYAVKTDYLRIRGEGYVPRSPASMGRVNNIWAQSVKGARIAEFGQFIKGWGVAVGAIQLGAFAVDIGSSLGHAAIDWRPRRDSQSPYEFGNTYTDIGGAYTQRQRAIMAIHDSQLTSRAAIGGEAAFMHN